MLAHLHQYSLSLLTLISASYHILLLIGLGFISQKINQLSHDSRFSFKPIQTKLISITPVLLGLFNNSKIEFSSAEFIECYYDEKQEKAIREIAFEYKTVWIYYMDIF